MPKMSTEGLIKYLEDVYVVDADVSLAENLLASRNNVFNVGERGCLLFYV